MQQAQGGLTSQEIIELLNSDFEFGVNFIIDNNPAGVESNISSLSIPLPQNPSNLQLREVIDTLLQNGDDPDAVSKVTEILQVNYLDTTANYTAGFSDYFRAKMPPAAANESVSAMVVSAIGGILNTAGTIWAGYKQEDIAEIQAQMQQDQIAFELEKIERTKILGIPQAVFIAVIVFVMFVALIIFLSNRK